MRRALILVAHADDESLGCGGVIQKLVAGDWQVSVVFVSDGIVKLRGKVDDNREAANAACEMLGVSRPTFLDFPCNQLDTVSIAEMANAVAGEAQDPDLILTHWHRDLNRDHRLVSEAARIVGRPRSKPVSIVECEIPNTSFWSGQPFLPNYFVDITDEIETKIETFALYENEVRDYPHPWSREALRLLAQYHGMQCGYRYAEAFFVARGYEGLLP